MLKVYTTKETFTYEGDDAGKLCRALNDANIKWLKWSPAVELLNGNQIIFVMNNIIAIEYK